ncbi:MAG TPA: Spy/CpxP family protein refolding chaperone [Terriglobales bacterium]|nr:Spy/CpxP family protein refolding chaperone [Terriglobales bacterium]
MKRFAQFVFSATAMLTLSAAQLVAQNTPTTTTTTDQHKSMDAQHQRHMAGKMGRRGGRAHMQKMSTELGLTEAQKTQLKALHEQERTKAQELRVNTSLTKEQKMEQMKALRESSQSQMKSILTPEQQTKFETMKQNRKEHMGKHGRRGAWGNKTEGQKPDSTQK